MRREGWTERLSGRAIEPLIGMRVTPGRPTTLRLLAGVAAGAGWGFWRVRVEEAA